MKKVPLSVGYDKYATPKIFHNFLLPFVGFVAVMLSELDSSECELSGEVRLRGRRSKKKISRWGQKDKQTNRHPYILVTKLMPAKAKGHFK